MIGKYLNTSVVLLAVLTASCEESGSSEGEAALPSGISGSAAAPVENEASGAVEDSSLEASVENLVPDTPEEEELTLNLNNDKFFNLTFGPDESEEEITPSSPENAKVVYYDVQTLPENRVPVSETETNLEGDAELRLQSGEYYVIEVQYASGQSLKALIGPDIVIATEDEILTLDIRMSRVGTIAADVFTELTKDPVVLALIKSEDVKTQTIHAAASELVELIKKNIPKRSRVLYWKSELYNDTIKDFASRLSKELLTLTPYSNEFAAKKTDDVTKSTSLKVPPVDLEFEIKPDSVTTFIIRQATCQKRPSRVGEFKDNYQNSSKDYVRCLKRAAEYHRWCGNSVDEITVAEFRQDGEVVVSADSETPFEGCFISADVCTRDAKRTGTFIDTSRNASTDIDRCMMRAHDYHRWCRNKSDDVIAATFYEKGVPVQRLDSKTPYTGCFVGIDSCKRVPEKVGLIYDNHKNSSTDIDRCMMRAHDFHRWCRNDNNVKTTATFYAKGEIVKETDSQTAYSGCFIEMSTCRKRPERTGLFIDNHKNASSDQDRCLRRAAEYHRWCGNSFDEVVKASFYDKGEQVVTTDSTTPYTGCFISQSVCQRKPERVGLFLDNYRNSSQDKDRCIMRAHDYHRSCRNTFNEVVTASFYEKGNLVASLDSQTPYSGCFIQMEVCQRVPEKVGLFIDNHKNASFDKDRCLMRAADFHSWCRNDFSEAVTASFYVKGDVDVQIDSKTPYSGCYIEQAACKRRPDKVGLFKDNYQNSSFDQDRCIARARDYHNWCRNDDGVTTTATFYTLGDVSASERYSGNVSGDAQSE